MEKRRRSILEKGEVLNQAMNMEEREGLKKEFLPEAGEGH